MCAIKESLKNNSLFFSCFINLIILFLQYGWYVSFGLGYLSFFFFISMANFLYDLLHSSQDTAADAFLFGEVDAVGSLVGEDDDVDYDALHRDTH